jgi:hypothetical protein
LNTRELETIVGVSPGVVARYVGSGRPLMSCSINFLEARGPLLSRQAIMEKAASSRTF